MRYEEARKDMFVVFGRENGEQTLGQIVKLNTKALVKTCENRGNGKGSFVGAGWRVPYGMMRPASEREIQQNRIFVNEPIAQPNEKEILSEINGIYCQLSPENLSCDGELSRNQITIRYRALQSKLQALFTKLGRTVSEGESFRWWQEERNLAKNLK